MSVRNLTIGIAVLILWCFVASAQCGCGSTSAQTESAQWDKMFTEIEGNKNILTTMSTKVENISTNQKSVNAKMDKMYGDINNINETNNPWPYVVIFAILMVSQILTFIWFNVDIPWIGRKR